MILAAVPAPNPIVVSLSLAYIAYYFVASVYLTVITRRQKSRVTAAAAAL